MGSSHSTLIKEGEGHPAVFYRGVAAALDGRYTVAELSFLQALKEHPGHDFWQELTKAVLLKEPTTVSDNAKAAEEEAEEKNRRKHDEPTVPALDTTVTPGSSSSGVRHKSVLAGHSTQDAFQSDPSHGETRNGAHPAVRRGDEDSSSEDVAPAPDAAQTIYSTKVVDIRFPLNQNLASVLNFFRLLSDIAHTYLQMETDELEAEKVTALAARYCLFTISHTQMLLHCLTLWKEENIRDGLGLIDYAKTRGLKLGVAAVVEEDVEDDMSDSSSGGGAGGRGSDASSAERPGADVLERKWRGKDRTSARLFTMALAEANCRYHAMSALVNYCYVLMRTYGTVAERRQNHVYTNALDHLDAALSMIVDLAKEYPTEYISRLVLQYIPSSSACGGGRDALSSHGASSHGSHQRSLFVGNDQHRHLCAAGSNWYPTHSALIPLLLVRSVRLCVQESTRRGSQAVLQSPAQRMSYHYLSWATDSALTPVPGCSAYVLVRSLPGFVPGNWTTAHQRSTVGHGAGTRDSIVASVYPGEAEPSGEARVTAAAVERDMITDLRTRHVPRRSVVITEENMTFLKKCRNRLVKNGYGLNTDLNLSDERTGVMLCLNEAALLALQALLLSAKLRLLAGQPEAADPYAKGLDSIVSGLFGPESAELHLFRYMMAAETDAPKSKAERS
ncbi:hypothetical protein NESM_000259300 [Novymonas esmeraldas]|uniref:Uncharacterized protein n=1 Tax=Novymonas esmeraldas TaxID=1808958 RepID=A0AAW0F5P3_9TRYP